MTTRTGWILAFAAALTLGVGAQQPSRAQDETPAAAAPSPSFSFNDLQARTRALRAEEQRIAEEREAAFRAQLARQEAAAAEQERRRDREEARSDQLSAAWDANDARIEELTILLAQKQGNLGELFGVTRQVAGDASNVLQQSMLTAQYATADEEERVEFLRRLAGVRALPSIAELERMWYELMREMTDAAKVVRFDASVLQLDGAAANEAVVRVGPFTAVSGGEYLGYLPSSKSFSVLQGHLPGDFRSIARELEQAAPGGHARAVVDPARGALLGLYLQRPSPLERIEEGEAVGLVIIAVGLLGAALAAFQFLYLFLTRMAVSRQLADMSKLRRDNPLGRVVLAFREGGHAGEAPELAELRLSEAVLRELPKLERFQAVLRLAVAAGPLLGLIGTVVGMIITFHAITAAGTSDPRLMAQGIGQAMIATVLGLGIAIPLLFMNAGLAGLSRRIIQILDERSHQLLADTK